MIGALRETFDRFRGFGDHALSVPSLDGAFRPNDTLEMAPAAATLDAPDNIVTSGGRVLLSSGATLLALTDAGLETVANNGTQTITAMAGAADGRLAIHRSGQPITLIAPDRAETQLAPPPVAGDVTAMAFLADGGLAVTIGAEGATADQWKHDLMSCGDTGSVWIIAQNGTATQIARKLAWPNGIVATPDGDLLISTAWDAALVRLKPGARPQRVVDHLPGYPGRIVAASNGGYWLSVFAPRNQLVEFVLREKTYRTRMMTEIDPAYWVCPALAPASSPLEVMQDGAQKIGGSIKPWAPSLSYGMVVYLDADFLPQFSFHSRANGTRHGVTSLVEHDNALLITSQGANAVLRLDM